MNASESGFHMSTGFLRARVIFRLFGLVIGVVSTSYFAFVFWLMMNGLGVWLFETNKIVVTVELSISLAGLAVLITTLLSELVKSS